MPALAATAGLRFDTATPADLDAIRRMIHRTFAEEIPQHPRQADGRLVDKFEDNSVFIVARAGEDIVGMVALRQERPFSLDGKVDDLDRFLPPGRRVCELRLLSVDPSRRQGVVLRGLLARMGRECVARGFDTAVLSATTRQLRLYEHLGCVPFGPLVGTEEAPYQPMFLTREALVERMGDILDPGPHCFLTGPVTLSAAVRRRIATPLASHRGPEFAADLGDIRRALGTLIGARHVAVFAGSGTLANDVVAAQIAATGERVVVLANGEFGHRLVDHARRHNLAHVAIRRPWGTTIDADAVATALQRTGARWVWAVHCETSTGMLNNLDGLRDVAARHGARLALDAASSAGTVPLNLDGVALASTVSGKALGAVGGLAVVCAHDLPAPLTRGVPRYLDLAAYLHGDGVPFTQPSLLVGALAEALRTTDWEARFGAIVAADRQLRARMAEAGIRALVEGPDATPAVATWIVPPHVGSAAVGAALERNGFQVSWHSGYLRERGWVQTALFGDFPAAHVGSLADALVAAMAPGDTDYAGSSPSSEGSLRTRSISSPRESIPSF